MNFRSITFLLCTVSTTAFAQSAPAAPTSPAPAAAQQPALATHNCVKPQWPDAAKKLSEKEKNVVLAELEALRSCVHAFSDVHEKIKIDKETEYKALLESAKVALEAAKVAAATVNTAVIEYNTFSAETVKFLNKDAPPGKKPGIAETAPPPPSKN